MVQGGKISGFCLATVIAVLAVMGAVHAPDALARGRVALVIGNDRYDTLPDLNNAATDARGMAARLSGLGFEVIVRLNAGRRSMGRALAEFENRAADADVALVFYAGHGIQSAGRNYLIPSNAQVEVEDDLRFEGIEAGAFLDAMKTAGSRLNIVIMDACRDNPLPRRSRSAARGLTVTPAPMGSKGTAIIYSAAPGQTAQDGPRGGHGVFTGALLRVLEQPGLNLEQVFKETARRVSLATGGKQDPWINSSLKGEFYFNAAIPSVPSGAASAPAAPVADRGGGGAAELLFWDSIKDSGNEAAFRAYLKQYPRGVFVALARLKLQSPAQDDNRIEERDTNNAPVKAAHVRAAPAKTAAPGRFDGEWTGHGTLKGDFFDSSNPYTEVCNDFTIRFQVRGRTLNGTLTMGNYTYGNFTVGGRVLDDGTLADAHGKGAFDIKLIGTIEKGRWELVLCSGIYVAHRG